MNTVSGSYTSHLAVPVEKHRGGYPVPHWGGFEGRQAHDQLEALGLTKLGLYEAANRHSYNVMSLGATTVRGECVQPVRMQNVEHAKRRTKTIHFHKQNSMLFFGLFGSPAAADTPVSAAYSHADAGRTSTLGDRPFSRLSDARHLKHLHSPDVTTRMTAMMTHVSSTPSAVGACSRSPESAPRTGGTGTRSGSPAAAATIKHQSSMSSMVATGTASTRVHMPELSARGTAKPPRMISLPSAGSPSSIAKQVQLQEDTPSNQHLNQHKSLSLPDAERRATTRRLVQSLESRSAVGISSPPTLEIRHTRESAAAPLHA
jgi:hypothetical protein